MAKLTDTQLIVLSKAAARDDGAATAPEKLNRAAAAKVGASLVGRTLMEETQTKPGMPIWREDIEGHSISLVITAAGRVAIGVEEEPGAAGSAEPDEADPCIAEKPDLQEPVDPEEAPIGPSSITPRSGTKQALVTQMLSRDDGATLDDLVAATGWLPHTTRAALTGLRKRGLKIERRREEGEGASIYQILVDAKDTALTS